MAIVIPQQMYVGYQTRHEQHDSDEETKLGFATYYEDNKAFQKRKTTIDDWAERCEYIRIDETHPKWNPDGHPRFQQIPVDRKYYPETIDNTLMEGFKIARAVRRYGWNGGNVVWRIEDPRGFELEIPSANMASIMATTTMVNGEIQGKCIWAWDKTGGSRVILLPENSEPYNEAIKDTALHNAKPIRISDVNIGDKVKLKNGKVLTYAGSFYYVTPHKETPNEYDESCYWATAQKKSHFFFDESGNTNRIEMVVTPKIVAIVESAKTPIPVEQTFEEINTRLRLEEEVISFNCIDINAISMVPLRKGEIKLKQISIDYETAKSALEDWRNEPYYSWRPQLMVIHYNGRLYRYRNRGCSHLHSNVCTIDVERLNQGQYYEEGQFCHGRGVSVYFEKTTRSLPDDYMSLPMSLVGLEIDGRLYSARIY